ncbi:hypothetical protein ACFV9E_18380 [Streptomyces sp. NPDC059835]|uniref:hypothetical protein n=1 Tax=Streptomyces sp. NPDC059835 TaxID=3346967 RepID=UPI0036468338
MPTLTLPEESTTFRLTPRPARDADYAPLPHGLTLGDAVLRRAHQVRAGDLVIADFPEAGDTVRVCEHLTDPYPADPHTLSSCPCQGCEECDDFDESGFAAPHTTTDRNARYVCLAPSDDDEPCGVYFRNAPIAVIPAAAIRARTGRPAT